MEEKKIFKRHHEGHDTNLDHEGEPEGKSIQDILTDEAERKCLQEYIMDRNAKSSSRTVN